MAAYGNIRRSVAECPRKSPTTPSLRRISCTAASTPAQLPVYLMNCGFEAWNKIFTRSRGAMRVFACQKVVSTWRWREHSSDLRRILQLPRRGRSVACNREIVCGAWFFGAAKTPGQRLSLRHCQGSVTSKRRLKTGRGIWESRLPAFPPTGYEALEMRPRRWQKRTECLNSATYLLYGGEHGGGGEGDRGGGSGRGAQSDRGGRLEYLVTD